MDTIQNLQALRQKLCDIVNKGTKTRAEEGAIHLVIKKISENITYLKKTTTFELEVNGKKVIAYEYVGDDQFGDYEYDVELDEKDKEALTEEEEEALSDYLQDVIKLQDGEDMEVDY